MDRGLSGDQMQVVQIINVGSNGITCKTQAGTLTINFDLSNTETPPKVNEVWLISKVASNKWRLWNKVTNGNINVMRYVIRLNASRCIGKERAVVDDIVSAGFDEVLLTVADNGFVYWDSDICENYGLKSQPILKQLLDRFRNNNVAVIVALSSEIWSDTTNDDFATYQQQTNTGVRSRKWSASGAKDAIVALIDELRLKYGSDITSYCLDGIGLAGLAYDRNPIADKNFYSQNKIMPSDNYIVNGIDDNYLLWREFLSQEQRLLCQAIKDKIGITGLIAIVPDYAYCLVDSDGLGYARSGIDSSFGGYGWSYAGMPIAYQHSADPQSELRSFEACVAICCRLGEQCKPIFDLSVPDITQPYGMFSILAKYGANQVIVGDYDDYKVLSDEITEELWRAMDKYRITNVNNSDYDGLVLSMQSLNASHWQSEANIDYMESWYSMASLIVDKTSHRLRILFDDDLNLEEKYNRNAATCLFMVSNMTDDIINAVTNIVNDGGRYLCLIGRCGYLVDDTTSTRTYPFLDLFGESATETREYIYSLTVKAGYIEDHDRSFYIDLGVTGYATALNNTIATGYDQTQSSDGAINIEVQAPIMIKDRHVYMAMDIEKESMLGELASELFLYSISRES